MVLVEEESVLGSLLSHCRENLHRNGAFSLQQLVPVHQTLCQCMPRQGNTNLSTAKDVPSSLDCILKIRCDDSGDREICQQIIGISSEPSADDTNIDDDQDIDTSKDPERLFMLQFLMHSLSLVDSIRYVLVPFLVSSRASLSEDLELALLDTLKIPSMEITESQEWQATLKILDNSTHPSASRILVRLSQRDPHSPLLIASLYEKVWQTVKIVNANPPICNGIHPSTTFQNHPTLSTLSKDLLTILTSKDALSNLELHRLHMQELWRRLFDDIWHTMSSESLEKRRVAMLVMTTVLCPLLPHLTNMELPHGGEMFRPVSQTSLWSLIFACVSQGTSALDNDGMASLSSILRRRGLFLLNTIVETEEWKQYVMCYETLEMEQEQHLVDQIWGLLGQLFSKVSNDPDATFDVLTWDWMAQLFGCVLSASLPVVQKRSMYQVLKAHLGMEENDIKANGKTRKKSDELKGLSILDKMPPHFMLKILLPSWNSLGKSVGYTFNRTLQNRTKARVDMTPMMKEVLMSYIEKLDSEGAKSFWCGIWDWNLIQHFSSKTFMFVLDALAERAQSKDRPVAIPIGDSELRALSTTLRSHFLASSTVLTSRKTIMERVATLLAQSRSVEGDKWNPITILHLVSLYKSEYLDLDSLDWAAEIEPMLASLKIWLSEEEENLSSICPVLATAFIDGKLELSTSRPWDPENGTNCHEREIAWGVVLLASLITCGSTKITASQFLWPAINKGLSNTAGAIMTKSHHKADHVSRALLLLESGCLQRQLSGMGNGDLVVLSKTTQQLMPVPPNIENMLSSTVDFNLFHIRTLLDIEANDGTNGSMQTSATYARTVSQLRTLQKAFPSSHVISNSMSALLASSYEAVSGGGESDGHRVMHAMLIYAALSSGAQFERGTEKPTIRCLVALSLKGDRNGTSNNNWEHMARSILFYAKWACISKILPLLGKGLEDEVESYRIETQEFIEWVLAECFDAVSAAVQDAVIPVFNCIQEAAKIWFKTEVASKDDKSSFYVGVMEKIITSLIGLMQDATLSYDGVYMLNQLCSLIFQPHLMREEYARYQENEFARTPIRDGFRHLIKIAGNERDHITRSVLCMATVGWLDEGQGTACMGLNAIPYLDDLVNLLLHKEVKKDDALKNQYRLHRLRGMDIPSQTNASSVTRAFILVFIEKLPDISDGLNHLVLKNLLEPLILRLLVKAEPIRSSKPSLVMKGTHLYCQKMRAWQALCNLPRFITSLIAPQVCESVFSCLEESIHSEVRYFAEVFTVKCGTLFPDVFGNKFLEQIVRTDLSLQQVASLMIMGGNWIVGGYKLAFFRPSTSDGVERIRVVASGAIPWLSSTQGFSRAIAQLLVYAVIPLVLGSTNLKGYSATLDDDGVLRLIYNFLDENKEMARLRKKQIKFFEAYDIKSICSATGVLSIPVDESDEADPSHLVDAIKQTLKETYDEAHATDIPFWKQVEDMALATEALDETSTSLKDANFQRKIIPLDSLNLAMESQREIKLLNAAGGRKQKLIVCASLIDKIPNLGGLARTAEIFAADRLVVPDKAVCKMDNFQNISVGAADWIDVEEVRPKALLSWLLSQKTKGYFIFGLEQTASSISLDTMVFPDRPTILLLGKEKEGIPVELLQAVDQCVEIPQLGIIRSLNVHVSGAIAIWEHMKQSTARRGS